jgi:hypothetical protein
MIEYFAMSVSYTPIPDDWRKVLTRLIADFKASYGLVELPVHARWAWADMSQHALKTLRWFEIGARWFDELAKVNVPTAPLGQETWLTMDADLAFGRRTHSVDVRVRAAPADGTCVEIWFPTYVHMDIFRRNLNMKEFDPEAKAALMRVLTGVGKLLGAEAFAYQNATEDSLFGPPSTALILEELDQEKVWLLPKHPYKIAGMRTENVPAGIFEPDDGDPPWHYRRAGYDVYDSIWPDPPDSPGDLTDA